MEHLLRFPKRDLLRSWVAGAHDLRHRIDVLTACHVGVAAGFVEFCRLKARRTLPRAWD